MRILAAILVLVAFTIPAHAGIIWDETVNGELSHAPSTPTILPFSVGSNVLNGSVGNIGGRARDYIRFILPPGHLLTSMNLLAYSPDDIGFTAINAGVHSFFPSPDTDIFFASGIHLFASDVGFDLMDLFVNRSVTAEALGVSELEPGSYCMVIQQTGFLITTYSIEFIMTGPVPTQSSTWGSVKALYR